MQSPVEIRTFDSRAAASAAAADLLAGLLEKGLAEDSSVRVSMVVSGGSTPGECYDLLSTQALDWSRVTVVPSDERWVAADHPDSNERLIRARLLRGRAAQASLLSFARAGIGATTAPGLIEQGLQDLNRPFSASLLGMGEDGHFASLFPDYEDLQTVLDPQGRAQCISVRTAGSPYLRISLTLSALLDSAHIVLLVFGESKRGVLEAAGAGGSAYPIESLLQHARGPVTVIWAA
jgi:6-phosphogluconolactonase